LCKMESTSNHKLVADSNIASGSPIMKLFRVRVVLHIGPTTA